MKKRLSLLALLVLVILAILPGCSDKNSPVAPAQTTDGQALKTVVATADSVAGFSASDELTIDDNGLENPEFDNMSGMTFEKPVVTLHVADSLSPVRWGRKIFWESVTRNYDVTTVGDTLAYVLVTKIIPGEFRVAWGIRTPDTVIVDTVVAKPFTETVHRKVVFKRIARTDNPMHNWVPVAITMVVGKSGGAGNFQIASVEFTEAVHNIDTSVTDPLNQWFRLGRLHGSVPVIPVGDSLQVRLTVTSADSLPEIAVLRHGIAGGWLDRRRGKMTLDSTTGGPGAYTRVYSKTFHTGLPDGILAARFNAVVDVISNGTVFSMDSPFANEFWGAPYIVAR
jgi:hypothetical protein